MSRNSIISFSLILLMITAAMVIIIPAQNANSDPPTRGSNTQGSVIWETIGGMTGQITTEMELVDQTNTGTPDTVLIGTDGGAMAIDLLSGEVYTRYTTLNPVLSITDVSDIDGNGRGDIVITTRDQNSPNVIAISTETGEKLWDFKPIVKAYTDEEGIFNAETISWSVDSIETNGGKDVILSSWWNVFRLSGDDGDIEWTFQGSNDIWTVGATVDLTGDGKPDVLAGSQDGDIHLLDGKMGDEVWTHDLTSLYEKIITLDEKRGGEGGTVEIKIDLSLWSILNIEDVNGDNVHDVVVSSEDGFITLISGADGDIIWSKKITLQNEPNVDMEQLIGLQTSIDDLLNFNNPRIKTIEDFDEDGLMDILVMGIDRDFSGTVKIISSSTGIPLTRQGKEDPDRNGGKSESNDDDGIEIDEESILFTTTGTDALSIPVIISTEAVVDPDGTEGYYLLLPMDNEIKLVDTETKYSTSYFDHPILDNAPLRNFQLKFFDDQSGLQDHYMIMTLGTSGLLVVDPLTHDLVWEISNLENVEVRDISDITDDGIDDLMALSYLGYGSSVARSIYTIDRVTGEELWRYSVAISDLSTLGPRGINIEHDLTGDGHIDVLCFRQSDEPGKLLERGNHSFVFLIDGSDGSVAWERQVTDQLVFNSSLTPEEGLYEDFNAVNRRITSLDLTPDQNGDSIRDVIIGGEDGMIYLLDGSDGSQLWNKTYDDIGWQPWAPQISTLETGSTSGLIITSSYSSEIFFSDLSAEDGLSANYSWRYPQNMTSPDNDQIITGSVRIDADIDGDGSPDVTYFNSTNDCHVLSSLEGSPIGPGFPIGDGYPYEDHFVPGGSSRDDTLFVHDLNGNGFKDAVILKILSDKRATPQIIAIDGQTHQEIWVNDEIFQYVISSGGTPMRFIDDTNADGVPDIVLGITQYKTKGADIRILDGAAGDELSIIQYEEQVEFSDWNTAQPVYQISTVDDLSGDGKKDFMIQRSTENSFVLELVDPERGSLLRQIPLGYAVAIDNGDINSDGRTDILVSQGNSMYCLDGSYGLSILSPENDDDVGDEFLLEWSLSGVECEVFVDGISYGIHDNGEVSLVLSGGEHDIIVETTDEFGGMLSDTITVNVPESNLPLIINISAGMILVLSVVALFIYTRYKLKKRDEHWRKLRRDIISSEKKKGKKKRSPPPRSEKKKPSVNPAKPEEVSK